MATTIEYIYNDRDNTIDLQLKADGSAVDLSSVTRVEVIFTAQDSGTDKTIDTEDAGTTLADGGNVDITEGSGKLILALGDQSIAAGNYLAQLVIYDPTNTDGVVWGSIPIVVE